MDTYPIVTSKKQLPHDKAICGAKTRAGGKCQRAPMPNGRCYLHGGKSTGQPIKHGLYAVKHHQTLGDKIQKYLDAPIDDLSHELALTRALLQDFLDKVANSPNDKERYAIIALTSEIRNTVTAINKIRTNTALTGQEIQLLVIAMSTILKKYVPSDDLPNAIDELRTALQRR